MYRCQRCDYSSTRRYDLRRHERRKIPCVSKQAEAPSIVETQNVSPSGQIVSPSEQNVSPSGQNVSPSGQNVSPTGQNVSPTGQNVFQCERCKKAFSSIKSLKRHNISCKGVDALTCPRCFKTFNTRKGKHKHLINVNCIQKNLQNNSDVSGQHITNNTNVLHTTNVHNDHCTVNNNITIKFGEECLEKLIANPDYFKRMEESMRLGKYAIPQHMNDIFFNESFPMNNTIMKSRHNDRFVKIKTGNDQCDTRVVDDVYKSLINKMESYMHPYFSYMEKRMETIYDDDPAKFRRMTRSIREYGHKVLWLDWNCEDIRQIGVDLNDPYCETERQRRIQEMKSLLLEHIYDKTREVLAIE